MTAGLSVSLSALAREQEGVVGRAQLRALGWTAAQIRNEIRTRRWTPLTASVIGLQNAPLTYAQRLWLGVLHGGPGSVLSHATGCQRHGLRGWDADRIEMLTPRRGALAPLPGFWFRQTRRPFDDWIHPSRTPPTLCIEVAALLAAERDPYLPRAIGRLAAIVQQRLSTAERLLSVSTEIPKLRHGRVLRRALGDIGGGAQSFAELKVGWLCRSAGLRPPDRQRVRPDATGRRRYLDCEWDLPDGRVLVLEVDGSFHFEAAHWSADMRRERDLIVAGCAILRCSSVELRLTPDDVIRDLRRMGVPAS